MTVKPPPSLAGVDVDQSIQVDPLPRPAPKVFLRQNVTSPIVSESPMYSQIAAITGIIYAVYRVIMWATITVVAVATGIAIFFVAVILLRFLTIAALYGGFLLVCKAANC